MAYYSRNLKEYEKNNINTELKYFAIVDDLEKF